MAHELEFDVVAGDALKEALKGLPEWRREGKAIEKTFEFASYLEGVEFARRVADTAESLDHHPEIVIGYKKVTVRTWTHKKDAITKADLTLAQEVEGVV